MLGSATGCSDRRPHYERHLASPARHVTHLGGVINDLITRQKEKIAVLHIGNGSHSHHGGADSYAEKTKLSDRGVNHPIGKPLFEAKGDGECTTPATRHGDIFPNAEDGLLPFHFLANHLTPSLGHFLSLHV